MRLRIGLSIMAVVTALAACGTRAPVAASSSVLPGMLGRSGLSRDVRLLRAHAGSGATLLALSLEKDEADFIYLNHGRVGSLGLTPTRVVVGPTHATARGNPNEVEATGALKNPNLLFLGSASSGLPLTRLTTQTTSTLAAAAEAVAGTHDFVVHYVALTFAGWIIDAEGDGVPMRFLARHDETHVRASCGTEHTPRCRYSG